MFSGQNTASKVNVMFLAVVNKEITCRWLISSGNCDKTVAVHAF